MEGNYTTVVQAIILSIKDGVEAEVVSKDIRRMTLQVYIKCSVQLIERAAAIRQAWKQRDAAKKGTAKALGGDQSVFSQQQHRSQSSLLSTLKR